MAQTTLLDLAKLRYSDPVVGLIDENRNAAPELNVIPMRIIPGITFKTSIRTGFATTGFRQVNGGWTPSKSLYDQRTVSCYPFGGVVQIDKALVVQSADTIENLEMAEASSVMQSALLQLGLQIFGGVTTDANGFPGIKAYLPKGGVMTYDATGSTAATASSVYALKLGNRDLTLVGGNNTTFALDPFVDQQIQDANSKWLPGRVSSLNSWIGLQISHQYSCGRICNLTAQAGKSLTDAMLAELLALFPINSRPDVIVMSRRSRKQLQQQRTVTLYTGMGAKLDGSSGVVAPTPTDYEGIPIIATDSIGNADAIE